MKHLILLSSLILFGFSGIAQESQDLNDIKLKDYSELKDIKLEDAASCKAAEPKVLECANFLLKPYEDNAKNLNAAKFLTTWMTQTPDYQFAIGDKVFLAIKSDVRLMGTYLACQILTTMKDGVKTTAPDFSLKFVTKFLNYCETPSNKVKISTGLKKFIDAKHNGTLKNAIKM